MLFNRFDDIVKRKTVFNHRSEMDSKRLNNILISSIGRIT